LYEWNYTLWSSLFLIRFAVAGSDKKIKIVSANLKGDNQLQVILQNKNLEMIVNNSTKINKGIIQVVLSSNH
jgi:hypothetical protein